MYTKTTTQATNKSISDCIKKFIKCKECDNLSQPIAETNYYTNPECRGLDIYVCAYCQTCFCLEDRADGLTERYELSSKLIHSTDDLPF